MRFKTLDDWLAWQETLHPRAVDLGLERVAAVADALELRPPPFRVITVAGTNGKGSCAAWLTALARAAGLRTGTYTSPHLLRYNERVAVDGAEAGDAALCEAFAAVDAARGAHSLTYFEFGTLAALRHFRAQRCALVVLEVGLGGRLDATNVLEADVAVVVSVGLDHTDWLGPDREAIGREKAGIFRAGRPAVCADREPPASVLAHARRLGARLLRIGADFDTTVHADGCWDYRGPGDAHLGLPRPGLPGAAQYANAAAALAALASLPQAPALSTAAVAGALGPPRLRARLEVVAEAPRVVVDVAHNPDAAAALARELAASPVAGRTLAVCGMLADKAIEPTLKALDRVVDHWLLAPLDGPRATSAAELARRARAAGLSGTLETFDGVAGALQRARRLAARDDRIVVFGSFLTAAAALRLLP